MSSLPNEVSLRFAAEQVAANARNCPNPPRLQPNSPHGTQPRIADLSHSHSLNTISSIRQEYVLSEDLFAGHRYNGAMSNVRRFFCLFITFDLLFTTLMWIICVTLSGENLKQAMVWEIIHYKINTSLFDIVMAAICRFTVLLLFYGLLYINHWIVIALSTSCTCIFLIAKVFLYDWNTTPQPVFNVLIILISFVLAWSEAWFLDFKVLPQEWLANIFFSRADSNDVERAPLIRSYVEGLPSIVPTESVGNFYSPMESPQGSTVDDGDTRSMPDVISNSVHVAPYHYEEVERESIIAKGKETVEAAWQLLNSDEWKFQKLSVDGDTIHYIPIPKDGKMYKLTGSVKIAPAKLFWELYHNVDNIKTWNPAVIECKRIQDIDEHTDITYQIAAETAGGMMTRRDFVSLRRWEFIRGVYIMSVISTQHPNIPPQEVYTRGENGVGCWAVRTCPEDPNLCIFEWVLNSPIKLWIPQYVLDTAFTTVLLSFLTCVREHAKTLVNSDTISATPSGAGDFAPFVNE